MERDDGSAGFDPAPIPGGPQKCILSDFLSPGFGSTTVPGLLNQLIVDNVPTIKEDQTKYRPAKIKKEGIRGVSREEEKVVVEEFITGGNWRGKHNSLSRGARADQL